jgi:hypothetical protein
MKKKVLIWVLAAVLVLSMAGCAAGAVSSNDKYVGMEPTAAAEAAAAETKDTTSISDLIRVPFGYLLDWLYTFTNNYGLALILFSLIVKLVLLPMSVKSKKSMLKMSRLSPQVKALEAKYGDDKQKYQLAVQQMYKEEGVSMGGGCLWSFIPLLILLPLYYVIREPITYMMHNSRSISEAIVAFLQASGENLGKNAYYAQLAAAGHIGDYMEELKSLAVTANANLQAMNFQFLGIDLAAIPTFRFWDCEGWSEIGLFLIPVVSAGLQAVSMWISQKMNNQVATNADGEQDADAAKTANQTNATMMLMMPLMSLWIGFSMPPAISIYWIAQAVFGAVQDYFLTKHYRKVYDEEDAVKQEIAAKRRAEEAEKERQRALRREQNPDGITDNVSKKKIRQQEKEAAEKAAKAYEARKNPVQESEEKKPLSGDPERPYSRGRAYDPAHYGRKRPAGSDAEQTEE